MHSRIILHRTHMRRRVLVFLSVILSMFALGLTPLSAAPPAQGPVVIDAVDDDPDNKLWNCETNHVPFGNQETDRSRCFTFRYTVPPEGISSATVHIALDTLGSLQDTDATIVAVAAPVESCAWGIGSMAGCVMLHGGFKGGEKSLNLNLLDIACDPSFPNTAEAKQLVLDALNTGVLHMLLQDDTSVYSAELVLNGGEPAFTCGTSEVEAATFIPTPGPSAAATTTTTQGALNALDQIFDPPEYLVHATGHGTSNGSVTDDWYFLFPDAPDSDGFLELPDGIGGSATYSTDYFDGPFSNPREVCAAAGTRVGDTMLQSWNGGDAFQCNPTGIPPVSSSSTAPANANPIAQLFMSRAVNELLTGTAEPAPPNQNGASTAAVAGAVALAIFAAANYLISSGGFIKSANTNAARERSAAAPTGRANTEAAPGSKPTASREVSADARAREATGGSRAASDPASNTPPSREGAASADAPRSATSGADASGADASTTPGGMRTDAAASTAPDLRANSGVSVGGEGTTNTGDLSTTALDKAAQEGISSVPDAKELVQDQLMGQVEKSDKRERLLAEQARLKKLIETLEHRVVTTRQALDVKLDQGENVQTEQKEWNRARAERASAQEELKSVVKELAALDEKKEDKQ